MQNNQWKIIGDQLLTKRLLSERMNSIVVANPMAGNCGFCLTTLHILLFAVFFVVATGTSFYRRFLSGEWSLP
jgi:hypothetical protein